MMLAHLAVHATFDQQMIYENYRDTIEAARVLGIQDPLIPVLKAQLPKLDPILIGDSGGECRGGEPDDGDCGRGRR